MDQKNDQLPKNNENHPSRVVVDLEQQPNLDNLSTTLSSEDSNNLRQRPSKTIEQDEIAGIMEIRRRLRKDEADAEQPEDSRTRSQRGIIAIVVFLALLTICHAVAAFYLFSTPEIFEHPHECLTPNCKRMGKWLSDAMDKSVDPCENFYQYTCGRWLNMHANIGKKKKKKKNKDEKLFIDTVTFLDGIPFQYEGNEKLGKFLQPKDTYPLNQILPFYQSCIFQKRRDMQGYKPFINLLTKLKLLYPVRGGVSRPSVARQVARIYKQTTKMFFIRFFDPLENFISIRTAPTDRELLVTNPKVYADTMRQTFTLLKSELLIEDEEEIDTIIYLVMRFEAELVVIQGNGQMTSIFGFPDRMEDFITVPKTYHPNFDERTASFRWDILIDELYVQDNPNPPLLFFNYLVSLPSLEDRFQVLLLEQFLRSTPYYTIFRYFQWSLAKMFAFDLTEDLQRVMIHIFRWTGLNPTERCFRSVFSNLNALAAERYTMDTDSSKTDDQKLTNLTTLLTSNILELAEKELPSLIYTRVLRTFTTLNITEASVQKISKLLPIFYEGLNMSHDKYFDNVLQAQAIKARNEINKMLNIYPFEQWPDGAYSLSDITLTSLVEEVDEKRFLWVPFGALYEPFFGNDLPIMDFAGYGFWMVCFYMMMYTTDDLMQVVAANRLDFEDDWRTQKYKRQEAELLPRWDCIYDSLGSLELSGFPGIKLDAHLPPSRVKNIADALAVEMITKIVEKYKNDESIFPKHQILPGFYHYSVNQLLFHSIARQACGANTKEQIKYLLKNGPTPFELRINGALRMSESFAKSWHCSKTSFMNPANKCEFFKPWERVSIPYNNQTVVV